jgi:ferric-dicitrate binding protein FerR (iron transport regulator)
MGWLTRRDPKHRLFEDGVRWVEAIKTHSADAEEFACWAMQSPQHVDAFRDAWFIWHDVRKLPANKPAPVDRTARVLGPCGAGRRAPGSPK